VVVGVVVGVVDEVVDGAVDGAVVGAVVGASRRPVPAAYIIGPPPGAPTFAIRVGRPLGLFMLCTSGPSPWQCIRGACIHAVLIIGARNNAFLPASLKGLDLRGLPRPVRAIKTVVSWRQGRCKGGSGERLGASFGLSR
jgi:hypothetical protein